MINKRSKRILFFVRSVPPYRSNRFDVDKIIEELIKQGNSVEIYDIKQCLKIDCISNNRKSFKIYPSIIDNSWISKILNVASLLFFCLKFRRKYDIVQLNLVRLEYVLFANFIKAIGKKLIIHVYGYEMTFNKFVLNLTKRIYNKSDLIIFTNKSLVNKHQQFLYKISNFSEKEKILILPQFQLMDYEIHDFDSKLKFKKELYNTNKKIILAGITGFENEQHEQIIRGLKLIELTEQSELIIIWPFSCRLNNNIQYLNRIKTLAKKEVPLAEHIFINEFISNKSVLALRFAADIIINWRRTDQLNAALIESNYAFCSIITRKELPYQDYTKIIDVESISLPEEIPNAITRINSKNNQKEILINNRKIAERTFGYDVINEWIKLYSN